MPRARVWVALVHLLSVPVFSLAAQSGSIRGQVSDSTGSQLANATIIVEGIGLRGNSNAEGNYEIRGVPAGTYNLRARLIGHISMVLPVTVAPGQAVIQNFTLQRTPVQLAPVDVVVGSRARHTASEELAVPVDVFTAEEIARQGTTETAQVLQSLAPSVNFPRQSVTDANDIVRPFTLRGLSPDHTLVLVNGWRRHQSALLNNFAYGMGAGSSGVDLNSLPSSAVDRIEVLRDGASAQYGSDAIAGVVNLVMKEGVFRPFLNAEGSRYVTRHYEDDGTTFDLNGGIGLGVGRGSLGLFAEYRDRNATNRAWADPFEDAGGLPDEIDEHGQVITKNNPVPQPNHHWGDGEEEDIMTFGNFRMPVNPAGTSEIYAFGGYSRRTGTGNGYRRYLSSNRNWPEIYPLGFLPEFNPDVTDYSVAAGFRGLLGGWSVDFGGTMGHNSFEYNLRNTLNASLGPCLDTPCAPGPNGILGDGDDPGIPNQTEFFAGEVSRDEMIAAINFARPLQVGLPRELNVAVGAAYRRESYQIVRGELASYINGGHLAQDSSDVAPAGSSVFPGFTPTDETDSDRNNFGVYADLETSLSEAFLVNGAARYERYSDFGSRVTGKLALRLQPSSRLTLRAAASTGFRAPGLSQIHFSKVTTNVIAGQFIDVGIFPVDHPASRLLGSRPLDEETSKNLSAGFSFSPSDRFNVTVDFFHIDIDDRIILGATFDDDTTLAILTAGGFSEIGGVQYFTNGIDTRTQGIDVTSSLDVPVGTASRLNFTLGVNYTRNRIRRIDDIPAVLANSAEPGLIDSVTFIGITEERPDWRATFTTVYESGRLSLLGRASYFGKFSSAQPGFCDLCRDNYGAKTLADAEVGYRFNWFNLSLGARNLFDTYPDQPSSLVDVDGAGTPAKDYNNNFGTFPWAAASPFGYNGRSVYLRVETEM
jgi:iron complex outermembrane receptor protein